MAIRLLITILLCLPAASSYAQGDAESLYQRARQQYYSLMGAGENATRANWRACSEQFDLVASRFSEHRRAPQAIYSQGLIHWNLYVRFQARQDLENAIGHYRRLLTRYPSNSLADDALYNIGLIYYRDLKQEQRAQTELRRLLNDYPNGDMQAKARLLLDKMAPAEQKATTSRQPNKQNIRKNGPVSLDGVQTIASKERTKVRISLSDGVKYNHMLLKGAAGANHRLLVDFQNTVLAENVQKRTQVAPGPVASVRVGQFKPTTARVVLDISGTQKFRIQTTKQSEIVVEVFDRSAPVVDLKPTQRLASQISGKVNQKSKREQRVSIQQPSRKRSAKTTAESGFSRKVIIDAGHGGDDAGAKGPTGLKEKDVTLKIAIKLASIIDRMPNTRAILTRKNDVFIPLKDRSEIANTERGDLFVSIHADASPKRRPYGISTYVFDNASDEYSKKLAQRENASVMGHSAAADNWLNLMLASMKKNFFTNESVELANEVQGSMVTNLKRRYSHIRDLGVRRALFAVLWNTNMPAILVETSFISNAREERRLGNDAYRSRIANSIARGVKSFMEERVAYSQNEGFLQATR